MRSIILGSTVFARSDAAATNSFMPVDKLGDRGQASVSAS